MKSISCGRCAPEGSKYSACWNTTSPMNTSDVAYIPQNDLLDSLTDSNEGWLTWHRVLILATMTIVMRIATYLVLKFIRKTE